MRRARTASSLLVSCIRPRGLRQLLIERLPVADTPTHEVRPFRDIGQGIGLLRQQSPQRGMMPAKLLPAGIPVLANALPQLLNFDDQLSTLHVVKIVVHCFPRGPACFSPAGKRDPSKVRPSIEANAPA